MPEQTQRIATLIDSYTEHHEPVTEHYESFLAITPNNIESFKRCHQTDNYFYKKSTNSHYLIELKASGDLDNKKAKAEKTELLNEFFMLKNKFKDDKTAQIKILFGTAYNKFGEGNPWKQERVKQYFAEDELLIGRDYWNFVCDDDNGFEVVFAQYKESASSIKSALSKVKELYF